MTSYSQVTIIIPAYNEEKGIGKTLHSLIENPQLQDAEIIVIDDGSSDNTRQEIARFPQVICIRHHVNQGYGSAILTGVRRSSRPYIVWFDADGQHRIEDLLKIIEALITNDLDYCIGVRGSDSHDVANRRAGKAVLRFIVQLVAGQPIKDFNSGLRGFRRNILEQYLHLLPRGFSASTTTTLLMIERRHYGKEVPIVVLERVGKSSVKQFRDGMRTMVIILRLLLLFKALYFYGTIGLLLTGGGVIYGLYITFRDGLGFPIAGAVIVILGIQIILIGLISDQISLMRRERFARGLEHYE